MFTLPDNWELASLLAKLLFYVGAFSIAGGSLCAWRYSNENRALLFSNFSYIFVGTVIGFHGALLGFLLQVGIVNDSGLIGMLDWSMISVLLDTSLGDASLLRLFAFLLAGASSVIVLKKLQHANIDLKESQIQLCFFLQLVALLALAFSQSLLGHVSVLSLVARTSVVLHFAAFALWIGCLYPFLQLSKSMELQLLQKTLKLFGNDAVILLCALFLGGVLMLFELIGSPMDFVNTNYGLALVLKVFLVLLILGVAAANKLLIVPALLSRGSAASLRHSIRYEIAIAVAVLIVTSYLATVVGPGDHHQM